MASERYTTLCFDIISLSIVSIMGSNTKLMHSMDMVSPVSCNFAIFCECKHYHYVYGGEIQSLAVSIP